MKSASRRSNQSNSSTPYLPIEDHGVIGDTNTVALVGMNGAIDFMCFPRFDSPTIFASLLDSEKGGVFEISPILENSHPKQMYLSDTNVLLTRFLSKEGIAEISDFMPMEDGFSPRLVRRLKTIKGDMRFHIRIAPAFDYGRAKHLVSKNNEGILFESKGSLKLKLLLRCSFEDLHINKKTGEVFADLVLKAGETVSFVLEEFDEGKQSPSAQDNYVADAFKTTVNYWRNWISKSTYEGRWLEMINRSALVLKLLTSKQFGSLVAAATFGLPEELGGERNWDYRYTWIRDASFTVYGLIRLGYTEEAVTFMKWIEDRCRELADRDCGSLQIMYGIDGRHDLTESILGNLEGYKKSSPVRIGNGAYDQLQLDIYGELLDSVYLADKFGEPISFDFWHSLVRLVDWVCQNWKRKDEGIWEVRGGQREFLFSRVMCWVALDRGIRLGQKRSFPGPYDKWSKVRDEIYYDIFNNFWDDKKQAFVQYKGANTVDASNLLMPLVRFISPKDPRWLSTLSAIKEELVEDSHVFRYRNYDKSHDGLQGEEGTFCMCSFWYTECISRSGDVDEARFLFEKMLGYSNHLGLYAEELGPTGEHLGNFPQAFTHLGLISAAYNINQTLSRKGRK